MMMMIIVIMIRDAWVVLVVVAVSQSIPGTWGAMMVVVLQVIIIIIAPSPSPSPRHNHFSEESAPVIITISHNDLHQTLSVEGESLTEEWIDVLAVTASFLCNCVAIIGARSGHICVNLFCQV